jgi:hypothetical protein
MNRNFNKKFNNLFKDKNFIAVILVSFLFYIIFFEYIHEDTKQEIFNTISNPIILISSIVLIGLVLNSNFTIGMVMVFTLIISLTFNSESSNFTNKLILQEQLPILTRFKNTKYNKESQNQDIVEGFKSKSFIEKTVEKLTNDLEEGIKENNAIEEKYRDTATKEDFDNTDITPNSIKPKKETYKNSKNSKNNKKNEKTIKRRKFDYTNKEDKSLVYSREVLKEVVNRINYEYEDREYLKKYIGSKFEEIIDLLGLLEED